MYKEIISVLKYLWKPFLKIVFITLSNSVLRIHVILGWIRIRGSMPLTNGSGYGSGSYYFLHWPSRCQQKTNFLTQFFMLITFWSYHFSKIKSQKGSQNSRNQGFSYYFFMMIEGSGSGSRAGSGSRSIYLTSGSGSGSATLLSILLNCAI